ncbi:MAG: gliding motility protein GldM [Paludibacteraceae bacterium]|nr:gliding motility protein GldM [Paludibacteraceae bacterium]
MGGAKNCPETPRQKMIGMMYLVLTAMLALNVSADILNGFDMVNNSLKNSIDNSKVRNQGLYGDMQSLYDLNPTKVGEWLEKANKVKEESDKLFNILQEFKVGIIALADGSAADPEGNVIQKRDNTNVAGEYAEVGTTKHRGNELKQAIDNYRIFVEEMFGNDSLHTQIYNAMFNTDPVKKKVDEPAVEWVDNTFAHMPAVAVVTMLSKYQSDVRNTEAELIQYFIQQQDAGDFRVNKIQARLIPDSKNVMQGGRYHAEIALMAVDTTKAPIYYLGNNQLESEIIDIPCNQIGTFPIKGRLEMIDQYGATQTYEFEDQYMVSAPAATVANVDMNVVYRGYDNKMEISVPGLADSQLRVSANGATMTKSGNQYICKPTAKDKITILVSADIDGKVRTIGQKEFRVRPVPSPSAFLKLPNGERWSPTMETAGRLKRQDLLDATIIAEYEDGMLNADFVVTEFTIKIPRGAGFDPIKVSGGKFSDRQIERLKNLKPKQEFLIEQIKYEMKGAKTAKSGTLTMGSVPMP